MLFNFDWANEKLFYNQYKRLDSYFTNTGMSNPVRPEYNGVITVTGLKENSLVKITDVNNNLIYQTSSLGGMAGWNGLNSKGERVSTGIYFVYGTSEDGKSGVVTKILFVK